ncbi:type II toxin-antitoxin system VapC family toxin [Candidatus Sumerlaeota bacterium]
MIVVDTNTIAYLLIPGHRSKAAREILKQDPEWAAPLLWRSEFRNVLARYMKQNALPLEHALRLMEEAEFLMRGGQFEVASPRILQTASESGCSAYDCEFVALAQDLRAPLVTSDKKLLNAFPAIAVSMAGFLAGRA